MYYIAFYVLWLGSLLKQAAWESWKLYLAMGGATH